MTCFCGAAGVHGGLCGDHVRFLPLKVKGDVGNKFVRCVIRGLDDPKEPEAFLRLNLESYLGNEDLVRLVRERGI